MSPLAHTNTQIRVNHSYDLTYSCCHSPPSPASPFTPSYMSVGNMHLMQTTNGTAVSSDWQPHHRRLTNHTTTLACQGADSSDFHKGSSALIVYVCVPGRSRVTRGASGHRKPNICIRAKVARGLYFTHPCVCLHMDTRRHIPAPSTQERALESTRDPGVNNTAISAHLYYQHYIRIYWPLCWVEVWSRNTQKIDSLKATVISGVFLSFCLSTDLKPLLHQAWPPPIRSPIDECWECLIILYN